MRIGIRQLWQVHVVEHSPWPDTIKLCSGKRLRAECFLTEGRAVKYALKLENSGHFNTVSLFCPHRIVSDAMRPPFRGQGSHPTRALTQTPGKCQDRPHDTGPSIHFGRGLNYA